MIGFLIAGAVTACIGTLCSTARDMHSDHLISRKELAEIEAKSRAFSELVDLAKHKVDRYYELEMKQMEMQVYFMDQIVFLTDKLNFIEDETKLNMHYNQILGIKATLDLLITGESKHTELISSNLQVPDFHNYTQIGERTTNYENNMEKLATVPAFEPQKMTQLGSKDKPKFISSDSLKNN